MTEYLNWGCEFISEPAIRPPERHLEEAVWLPIDILKMATGQAVEAARVNQYVILLGQDGIEEPGELVIGLNSCYLKDGNHRLLAAERLRWRDFPVLLRLKDSNLKTGMPLNKLIVKLIEREASVKYKKF